MTSPVQSVPTWAPPLVAARPKVVPLLFTTIKLPREKDLSLHEELPDKPRPSRNRRRRLVPPPVATGSANGGRPRSLSPLTPTSEDGNTGSVHPAVAAGPSTVRLVNQPPNFNLTASGWDKTFIKALRNSAKTAIVAHLQVGIPLSQQDEDALKEARLKANFPDFENHANFWGADSALRDQLRSMKDTNNARQTRQKRKGNKGDQGDQDENFHFALRAYRIPARGSPGCVSVTTISSLPARISNAPRMPLGTPFSAILSETLSSARTQGTANSGRSRNNASRKRVIQVRREPARRGFENGTSYFSSICSSSASLPGKSES
ncbi:hypothetical protein K435DRAFT_851303 [Dendrothele bispora CBS 962.96]|uniref:Uncharacterized protein n=1 Tax=Dendrothele bispora (strain CBS 962.96) TaxID=1314807 RepID=A0A4S8MNK1_DENBC|nr:hypothetical protein K435DRAFT_851303 [Dendrothele bispora CBS 962.96]